MNEALCKEVAYRHYFPECNGRCRKGWVLHHKDVELKHKDPIRYAEWHIEDLVPMTRVEHTTFHSTGNTNNRGKHISDEQKKKIISSLKGNKRALGKHWMLSESTKTKISNSLKGQEFTDERKHNIGLARKGKHWWNNGKVNVLSVECPSNDFVRGML